jgi:hypothetical protein
VVQQQVADPQHKGDQRQLQRVESREGKSRVSSARDDAVPACDNVTSASFPAMAVTAAMGVGAWQPQGSFNRGTITRQRIGISDLGLNIFSRLCHEMVRTLESIPAITPPWALLVGEPGDARQYDRTLRIANRD